MGLSSSPTVALGATDLLDPLAGRVLRPEDRYYGAISDELADKGFLVTTTDDLIQWARTGSLMWMTFGLACCAVEMMQVSMPRFDIERPDRWRRGALNHGRRAQIYLSSP